MRNRIFGGPKLEPRPDFCSAVRAESETGQRPPPHGTRFFDVSTRVRAVGGPLCNGNFFAIAQIPNPGSVRSRTKIVIFIFVAPPKDA
jgi:hypothetical protein